MNEKVTQMVELLFRDLQFSEEVRALHDEVLNNCQDRFADLVRGGLNEEEALAAVMESLKGMEDVLKDYPRIGEEAEAPETDQEEILKAEEKKAGPTLMNFSPEDIHAIRAQLSSCDVEVTLSDGEFSMKTEGEVFAELQPDGTLRLWQKRVSEKLFEDIDLTRSFESFESFGDAMNKLGQSISKLVARSFRTDLTDSRLFLSLPASLHPQVEIRTTSGDIVWRDAVPGETFSLSSTSGDIRIAMDESFVLPRVNIATTSGDVELCLSAEDLRASSISGDISWEGVADRLEMNSTSGDVEAVGQAKQVCMNSTSGSLEIRLQEADACDAVFNTVSGDIDVRLPASVREVSAELKSVSGEIVCRDLKIAEVSPVSIRAHTVSGDLKITG